MKRRVLPSLALLALAGCGHHVSEVSDLSRSIGLGGPAGEKGWQPDSPGQSSQTSRSSSDVKPKKGPD